ncbi:MULTISPECIES: lactate utilization protein C [unclassified Corynebacterium]|uniref:LutC/YkgG family protein n=1 Tax=Corynebacterium TaxID=1716 RepID=UPI002549C2CC|nr:MULTISPECIES: LUD domain-containing protein [unclassified Corynebacterium]MDK8452561.1 LUD domain-containing protein [Corynebacterium sp. MSK084]MDK8467376.1 LUD domain-containing protein [Corynebacterium sp. MSK130]MDK8475654.1 LUD domain-containing protein [Corynebacterium sp. MSK310]MDK8491227.1 LUD domain-containing protein [Corynebacterium sp. MSK175]MDK8514290.1 LUD domain-containing protein [Corynebacterium sp. MSK123]
MSAKQDILNRIRSAQKQAGLPDHVDVPREYQREGTLNDDELREMLVDRLEDYKAEVHVTEESDLKKTLDSIVNDRNCKDIRYAPGMNADLFDGLPARPDDEEADPRELDDADAVVTESLVSSAQTGTIVLQSDSRCGRRALTLVPDRHICIVRRDEVVYGITEVISRMNPDKPATWISGPSATSDIELSRVEGVHGPRDLIVIIVK